MNNRLNELKEVEFLAKRDNRPDILESIQDEMKSLQEAKQDNKVLSMDNSYIRYEIQDQIVSDHINNLIHYFGRDTVIKVMKLFIKQENQ